MRHTRGIRSGCACCVQRSQRIINIRDDLPPGHAFIEGTRQSACIAMSRLKETRKQPKETDEVQCEDLTLTVQVPH
jgi:hypothetical protein